jgi:arsenate reductase-like glutaredoxin family protein
MYQFEPPQKILSPIASPAPSKKKITIIRNTLICCVPILKSNYFSMSLVEIFVERANSFNRTAFKAKISTLKELKLRIKEIDAELIKFLNDIDTRVYLPGHGLLDQLSDSAFMNLIKSGKITIENPIILLSQKLVPNKNQKDILSFDIEFRGNLVTFFPDVAAGNIENQIRGHFTRAQEHLKLVGVRKGDEPVQVLPQHIRFHCDAVREKNISSDQLDQFVRELEKQDLSSRNEIVIVIEEVTMASSRATIHDHVANIDHNTSNTCQMCDTTTICIVVGVLLLLALIIGLTMRNYN